MATSKKGVAAVLPLLLIAVMECRAESLALAPAASKGAAELHLKILRAEVSGAPGTLVIELKNEGRFPARDLALAAKCYDERHHLTETMKSRRGKLSPGETWTVQKKVQHAGNWSFSELSGVIHSPL